MRESDPDVWLILDNPLLIEHLDTLIRGEEIERPNYDFAQYLLNRVDPET